jgi:hypothetical protein
MCFLSSFKEKRQIKTQNLEEPNCIKGYLFIYMTNISQLWTLKIKILYLGLLFPPHCYLFLSLRSNLKQQSTDKFTFSHQWNLASVLLTPKLRLTSCFGGIFFKSFFVSFCSTSVSTQHLKLTRQALYHFSHASNLFWRQCLAQSNLDYYPSILGFPPLLGWQASTTMISFFLLRWGLSKLFGFGLTGPLSS